MINFSSKRIIGGIIGVSIGLLLLFIGFWKTLLLASLGLIGIWLASDFKGFDTLHSFINKLFKR